MAPGLGAPPSSPSGQRAFRTGLSRSHLRPQALWDHLRRHHRLVGAYLLLLAAFVASITFAVLYGGASGSRGQRTSAAGWSSYSPQATGESGAERLAAHVNETTTKAKPRYLVTADVVGQRRIAKDYSFPYDVQAVAVDAGGRVETLRQGTAVYDLCGSLTACVLDPPVPTYARGVRLRQQALWLALSSLKQIGVDQVVVILPPRLDGTHYQALLFRRADWHDALSRPLARTLPDPAPAPASAQAARLDARVLGGLYRMRSQQTTPHAIILLLDQQGGQG